MAAAIKKVHIFENDGEFIVHPATTQLDANNNDEIEFVNHTNQDAVFYFGPGLVDTDGLRRQCPRTSPRKRSQAVDAGQLQDQQLSGHPASER